MVKRLAMTIDGKLTYCSATEENVGKGRCNHVGHALKGESQVDFLERTNKTLEMLKSEDEYSLSEVYIKNDSMKDINEPNLNYLRE